MSHDHKNARIALGAALGLCGLLALAWGAPAQAKVLAKVNNVDITDEDLRLALEDLGPGLPRQLDAKAREAYLLDFLIDEQLVVQEAQKTKQTGRKNGLFAFVFPAEPTLDKSQWFCYASCRSTVSLKTWVR